MKKNKMPLGRRRPTENITLTAGAVAAVILAVQNRDIAAIVAAVAAITPAVVTLIVSIRRAASK